MSVRDVVQAAAGALGEPTYIEDVFSTYLYTGNGSTQTITNGIDLATEGGLVWTKARNSASESPAVVDTERGVLNTLYTNYSIAQSSLSSSLTAFNSNGYSVGTRDDWNKSGNTYVSWTFRKAEKFFDVVTYTGNGTTQSIAHNLGSVPGCIIVKRVSAASNTGWPVYHRYDYTQHGFLNLTGSFTTAQEETWFGNNLVSVAPTASVFTVGSNQDINASSNTYVAYLFAHDAGGFGAGGSENVISCGSFTTDGSGNFSVNLGYEPQWIIIKQTNAPESWYIYDSMRGFTVTGQPDAYLVANTSGAEQSASWVTPSSTGFASGDGVWGASNTHIYIAIRRPMKPPTVGTEVFLPISATASSGTLRTVGFTIDLNISRPKSASSSWIWQDRMRGFGNTNSAGQTVTLNSDDTDSESLNTTLPDVYEVWNTTRRDGAFSNGNSAIWYQIRRASGFMDVVCYTGTGANLTLTHNLTVAPELVITKKRSATNEWYVSHTFTGIGYKRQYLEQTAAATDHLYSANFIYTAQPTASSLFLTGNANVNQSAATFVTYLFASYPGVSKVGSYTGTGTTQQINCGFTGGARFVLIKRTDSTGSWYIWDSARGIVAGNDPYLILNSPTAQITNTDYVDTYSAGFEISSTAPIAINANGGTYVFLAIS